VRGQERERESVCVGESERDKGNTRYVIGNSEGIPKSQEQAGPGTPRQEPATGEK
jgi:hypothetical protein